MSATPSLTALMAYGMASSSFAVRLPSPRSLRLSAGPERASTPLALSQSWMARATMSPKVNRLCAIMSWMISMAPPVPVTPP